MVGLEGSNPFMNSFQMIRVAEQENCLYAPAPTARPSYARHFSTSYQTFFDT